MDELHQLYQDASDLIDQANLSLDKARNLLVGKGERKREVAIAITELEKAKAYICWQLLNDGWELV